jgi:hypothetical protein
MNDFAGELQRLMAAQGYGRVSGPAGMCEAALAGEDAAVNVTIGSVQLIMLGRDRHVYEWDTQTEVRLAPARQA